jgi:hypothetical protein
MIVISILSMKQVFGLIIFAVGILIVLGFFGPLLMGGHLPRRGNPFVALLLSVGALYVGSKWMKAKPADRNGYRYGRK